MKRHPYQDLPKHCFWRNAVAGTPLADVDPVVAPKFTIRRTDRVATAGSCFAQHIARHLARGGFNYFVTEKAQPCVPAKVAEEFGYGLFTARYGNIYTSRQLLQLLRRAYGLFTPIDDVWVRDDGRAIDPFRPQIQPSGFASEAEYWADRDEHFAAVRRAVEQLDVLIFTLGLTEGWLSREDGAAYPLCPGVAGGIFDEQRHIFVNLKVADVVSDMNAALGFIRSKNPKARFILTVSPVPLVATATGGHALVSTTYSKSVLRVACEEVAADYADVAYFPSYEIITGNYNRGRYFAPDLRSVTEEGVSHVMRVFMQHYASQPDRHEPAEAAPDTTAKSGEENRDRERDVRELDRDVQKVVEVMCDEEALDRPSMLQSSWRPVRADKSTPKVIFVGNCQAESLAAVYAAWIAPNRGESVEFVRVNFEQADAAAKEHIRQADVIALQITNSELKVGATNLQMRGRVVLFPMVTGYFLWPFHDGAHPKDADIPPAYRKVFTGGFGDRWLDERIARGDDASTILEGYRDLDVVKHANLDLLVERVAKKQQQLDARADMHFGDYIMANLAADRLFIHMHHPNLNLFALMVRQVFTRMGCTSAEIERALSHYRATPFPPEELPIHPRIAEHLGLTWAPRNLKYRLVFGECATWEEYCQRYIAHDWSEQLQRCLARTHQNLAGEELRILEAELEVASKAYNSSAGYFALSDVRERMGDLPGSLDAVKQAVSGDPLAWTYATRHARLLVATGHLQEGLAAAKEAATWHPLQDGARIALFETYARLGQSQEAVQEARSALATSPNHPYIIQRLMELEKVCSGAA